MQLSSHSFSGIRLEESNVHKYLTSTQGLVSQVKFTSTNSPISILRFEIVSYIILHITVAYKNKTHYQS